MKDPLILGVTGTRGSGKDAFASGLLPYGWVRVALADKLKQIAVDLYGLSVQQVHGTPEDKERIDPRWGLSPRTILQRLGTEVGRSVHPETWTRYLFEQHIPFLTAHARTGLLAPIVGFVITDVRFPNEAAAVRARGGTIVRVVRPSACWISDAYAQHASEQEVLSIVADVEIVNDGTLEDLARKAQQLSEKLLLMGA